MTGQPTLHYRQRQRRKRDVPPFGIVRCRPHRELPPRRLLSRNTPRWRWECSSSRKRQTPRLKRLSVRPRSRAVARNDGRRRQPVPGARARRATPGAIGDQGYVLAEKAMEVAEDEAERKQ